MYLRLWRISFDWRRSVCLTVNYKAACNICHSVCWAYRLRQLRLTTVTL